MQTMYYIGLDVHKRTISYCVKDGSGTIHAEGTIPATRFDLDRWMKALPQPWTAAMEATVFTGWIYDHLRPHATALSKCEEFGLQCRGDVIPGRPLRVYLTEQELRSREYEVASSEFWRANALHTSKSALRARLPIPGAYTR
jgi:hypothetical protein